MNICDTNLHALGINASAKYLQQVGDYDVLNREWENAAGRWDLVMHEHNDDIDTIVFVDVDVRQYDMPAPIDIRDCNRRDMEHRAIAWIDAHRDDIHDVRLRFDRIDLAVIGTDRAIVRHSVNVLGHMPCESISGDAEQLISGLELLLQEGLDD